ncbi:aspartate aminotransferase family protein, partial [bacterium]|nr:aspartate aminotransferase family protein [bacterium]
MTRADCERCGRHLMLGGGTRGGPLIVRGQGVRLYDPDGKDYLDCTAQSWAAYLGFANDTIRQVVDEQMRMLFRAHQGFDTLPRYYLARRLAELAPGDLNRVAFTVGGGAAIESAMKIAHKNTQPSRDFICLYDGYHGTTLGSIGGSWVSTRATGQLAGGSRFLGLTHAWVRVPNPYCYRCPLGLRRETCGLACAGMLRSTLERGIAGNAAGVVLEPIQGSAGQIICPKDYLQAVRAICDAFHVPLIYDEIQTYARIGEFFAADYFGVAPDIIVLGKGLGAGLPLAAIIVSDKLEGLQPDAEDLHTFGSTTTAQVAAAKQIELLEQGVLENCRAMGGYLREALERLQREFPEIGDIRQAGLHIGVELVRDPESKEPLANEGKAVRARAMEDGLILGLGGVRPQVIKIKPPLVINQAECDEVIEKFARALRAVLRS